MRISLRAIVAALTAAAAFAHEPISTKLTWTQEISRIFYKHCVSCHHEGGGAPMSLVTYDEARPWAKAVRDEVLERRMPPWGAVKGVGEFKDDPSLSQPEIDMIVNWVEGGAPDGEAAYLPPVPSFTDATHRGDTQTPVREIVLDSQAGLTLSEETRIVSVRPQDQADGASMEVTAYRPDGSVERLIWLRNYRARWKRTYYFREPVRLPRGAQIAVYSAAPATAVISIAKPAR